jgi:hypothetical protein
MVNPTLNLKMEFVYGCEMSVFTYHPLRCHDTEDSNVKYQIVNLVKHSRILDIR